MWQTTRFDCGVQHGCASKQLVSWKGNCLRRHPPGQRARARTRDRQSIERTPRRRYLFPKVCVSAVIIISRQIAHHEGGHSSSLWFRWLFFRRLLRQHCIEGLSANRRSFSFLTSRIPKQRHSQSARTYAVTYGLPVLAPLRHAVRL
jgi:hypothetical protein